MWGLKWGLENPQVLGNLNVLFTDLHICRRSITQTHNKLYIYKLINSRGNYSATEDDKLSIKLKFYRMIRKRSIIY